MDRLHGKKFQVGPIGERSCMELARKRDSEALSLETYIGNEPEVKEMGAQRPSSRQKHLGSPKTRDEDCWSSFPTVASL